MDRRIELHEKLCDLIGSRHVYFQPPETVKLVYPCIVYGLNDIAVRRADNTAYSGRLRYAITVIGKDPDYSVVKELALWPLCSFNRHYTADNLNHWVFELYY